MSDFDADAILEYDAERYTPRATPEIEAAIRAMGDKPHFAPVILAELIAAIRLTPEKNQGKD